MKITKGFTNFIPSRHLSPPPGNLYHDTVTFSKLAQHSSVHMHSSVFTASDATRSPSATERCWGVNVILKFLFHQALHM